MIEIVLADDHKVARAEVRSLLEDEADFSVVSEASNGDEAVKITGKLKPHLLISDLRMPCLDGISVTEQVKRLSPNTRVIILSMYGDKSHVNAAFKAGACGYVLKKYCVDELSEAIWTVLSGKIYRSPVLIQ